MNLTRPKRARPYESIIPMIDVVFFLLVFFMLIGRMDATAPFEVLPATAQTGADMPAGGVTLSLAQDGTLALDGQPITAEAALSALQTRIAADPALMIRINAHRQAELRKMLPWIAALQDAGARDVVLVVTPEQP